MRTINLSLQKYGKKWTILDIIGEIVGLAKKLGVMVFRFVIDFNTQLFRGFLLTLISRFIYGFNRGSILRPTNEGVNPIAVRLRKKSDSFNS